MDCLLSMISDRLTNARVSLNQAPESLEVGCLTPFQRQDRAAPVHSFSVKHYIIAVIDTTTFRPIAALTVASM